MWCDVMWCLPVEVRGLLEETFASILILRTAFIDWGGVKLLLFVTKTRCVYCDLEKIYFLSHNLHWVPHFKKIQTAFNRYFFVLHAAVKKIFTYLLLDPTALWGPWPLTITNAHSSLSTAFCHHLLTFISLRSFTTYSNHLTLGLPLFYFPQVYSQIFS